MKYDMTSLENQLIDHEGLELKPYQCTADKLTIGVGRNIEDRGITEDEARYLLKNAWLLDLMLFVSGCLWTWALI